MRKIVLTGGGTAGHVTPHLALIPRLKEQGYEIHYIGTHAGIERELIEQVPDVTYHAIQGGKLRRYFDIRNLSDPFRVLAGAWQAQRIIGAVKPSIVFSKGGFVSVPVVYGAWLHRVPVLIHESDLTPGLANRISAPLARAILTTFPEAAEAAGAKGVCTGTPLRPELFLGNRQAGLELAGFTGDLPVLLMMGGSMGAASVNTALRQALPGLLGRYQVLHICGKGNLDEALTGLSGYAQFEYLNETLPDALAAADMVLSRAGSTAISEILALYKPALLIPYPMSASRGDQILNADSLLSRGLAQVLPQEQMTPETLTAALDALYAAREELRARTRAITNGDGTRDVLLQIEKYARPEK